MAPGDGRTRRAAAAPAGPAELSPLAAGAIAAGCAIAALLLVPLADRGLAGRLRHPDARVLSDVGWRWGLGRWEGLRAACLAASLILAVALGLPWVLGLLGAAAPSFWLRHRAAAAAERAMKARTRIVAAAEAALRSGASLPDALRRAAAASNDRLAARPFDEALAAYALGTGLDAALRSSAARTAERRTFVALETLALAVAQRLPRAQAGALVAGVAERLAFEERLDAEVRARAGGVRFQIHLLAALVPALALYLMATMPGLAATLDSGLGRTVLVPGALALEIAGVVLSRRIVRDILR